MKRTVVLMVATVSLVGLLGCGGGGSGLLSRPNIQVSASDSTEMTLARDFETDRLLYQHRLQELRQFYLSEANITNNHPILTGRIVLAHLKESLLYYERLDVAELEGDLVKAIQAGEASKAARIHQRLLAAKLTLVKRELASYEPG